MVVDGLSGDLGTGGNAVNAGPIALFDKGRQSGIDKPAANIRAGVLCDLVWAKEGFNHGLAFELDWLVYLLVLAFARGFRLFPYMKAGAIGGCEADKVEHMSRTLAPLLPSTEAALSLLETLLNHSYDAVLVTDNAADPKIIYANAAFEKLTGYAADEILGQSPRVLQGPSTDRDETARLGRLLREGKGFEGQAVNYRKDGLPFMMSWRVMAWPPERRGRRGDR